MTTKSAMERLADAEAMIMQLTQRLERAEGVLARIGAAFGNGIGPSSKAEADDSELDGRFGNPTVRKDPKRWAGASFKGANYSDCPSDYLGVLAEYLDWTADMDAKKPNPPCHSNGTPWFEYNRKDAARARGWARRNRGRRIDPPAPPPENDYADDGTGAANESYESTGDDEVPF